MQGYILETGVFFILILVDGRLIRVKKVCSFKNIQIRMNVPRGFPYKSDGDARQKIQIKPLRETNMGVAQA